MSNLTMGCNTYLGNRCYVNFNSTFLDCAEIRLGMMYLWGPMCPSSPPSIRSWPGSESCGLHRMDGPIPKRPASPLQWEIGFGSGNAVILPGVTIGDDTVIGAGSVVTRDIPAGVLAVGNPCRVLREITERTEWNNNQAC